MSSAAARYLFLHSQVSNLFDLNIVEIRIVARTPDARAPDDYMYMYMLYSKVRTRAPGPVSRASEARDGSSGSSNRANYRCVGDGTCQGAAIRGQI